MKVVLANGCFDGLHAGHVQHLTAAKSLGDMLVVALTPDALVNKGDGRPFFTWADRYCVLSELRCVDDVVESGENGVDAILLIRPHIYAKGCEFEAIPQTTLDACKAVGAAVVFTGARMSGDKKLSSS